ncbi:hypothetical protein TNCV_4717561 [Trichonephila clavipes]|nr:hypothetical protein TNCV_4717561 [Trichonephila clavipes]
MVQLAHALKRLYVADELRVRGLVELKTHRVERLMYVKAVVAESPPIDVVWNFREQGANSCVVFDPGSKLQSPSRLTYENPPGFQTGH